MAAGISAIRPWWLYRHVVMVAVQFSDINAAQV